MDQCKALEQLILTHTITFTFEHTKLIKTLPIINNINWNIMRRYGFIEGQGKCQG